ncbi:MAG: TetR family transcriptional regulator C-terminal domain-containing protein [Pseudomonadota bacterium]
MGRKSLQASRREEILERCESLACEEGLTAITTTRVARDIGIDRTTLHHYFRTQSDLYDGLIERIVDAYLRDAAEFELRDAGAIHDVIDYMMQDEFALPKYDRLVDEFAAAAHADERLAKHLERLYASLEANIVDLFAQALPELPRQAVRETAQNIYALAEGAFLLQGWGRPRNRISAARRAAHQLVNQLLADHPPALAISKEA